MNNFTAFILGALLAVILVGYVFFGSGDKKDVQPMPVQDMAASVDTATSPDATSAPKEVKESQPESVSKVDDAPAPEASTDTQTSPAPEASTDTQTSPALETAQDTQISPAPATGDAQPKDTGDVSDAAPVQDQTDTTAQQS